ncbi:hypothetical protein TNCV_957011 [Trichonephila clavipes]|nr:hypothetical protein TNCV_957011 [Trichonephila clavipes]
MAPVNDIEDYFFPTKFLKEAILMGVSLRLLVLKHLTTYNRSIAQPSPMLMRPVAKCPRVVEYSATLIFSHSPKLIWTNGHELGI